jgi:hypothetical protein
MGPPTMFPLDRLEIGSLEAEVPERRCNICNAKMELLADLREAGAYSAKRIFRCYNCDNVVSELR